jgi:hypothetical protein
MNHLRAGTTKDEEDAVEEAAKSVESVMKVLLQENRVALTGKETARLHSFSYELSRRVGPSSRAAAPTTTRCQPSRSRFGAAERGLAGGRSSR